MARRGKESESMQLYGGGKRERNVLKTILFSPKQIGPFPPVEMLQGRAVGEKNQFHLTFRLNHNSLQRCSAETSGAEMRRTAGVFSGAASCGENLRMHHL